MYYGNWFKDEQDAKNFQKEHGGILCKNTPRSRTKKDHFDNAMMFGFDPEKFKFSVLRRD